MIRNILLKSAALVIALFVAVFVLAKPAMAQTASHIYEGDVKVTATFGNGSSSTVMYDNDGASGQVIEVRDALIPVKAESPYGFQWLPYSTGNVKAAINDTLLHGCVDGKGCSSVRYFIMTNTGVQSLVINQLSPMNPTITITAAKGATYNEVAFTVTVSDVGLWNHSVSFGDGADSVFGFDQSTRSFIVKHSYFWKGGTFNVTLTATLQDKTKITKTIQVFVPGP